MYKGKVSEVIVYGPEETIAYTHYFMPSRFILLKRIMKELKALLPNYRPKRVFDFGCGPGMYLYIHI
jgi:ribosomal protein RSM22 (predicted rRNA methylase)